MPDEAPARWAARFKAWSDAASSAIKTLLLAFVLWLTAFAAGRVMWIEETTHPLRVDVGPEVQAAITAHGGDVDLRLALEDALNERIQAVRQIFQVQGLKVVGEDAPTQSVSFKPFGVEVSTDELTRLTKLVLNTPPPPSLRLELMCAPHACSDAGSHPDRLVMTLSQEGVLHRAAYTLAPGTAALRRTLRQAVQSVADAVLEQGEPDIAGVWFLNRGRMASMTYDQYHLDMSRAVGAAIAAKPHERRGDCMADLVIGASLLARGEDVQGVAAEQRAFDKRNATCRVEADTNVIIGLISDAFCAGDEAVRADARGKIDSALERLASVHPGDVPDTVYLRVPAARFDVQTVDLLTHAGSETALAYCNAGSPPSHGPAGQLASRMTALIDQAARELPPTASGEALHGIVEYFAAGLRFGIPRDDLEGRVGAERRLLELIGRYEATDPSPRMLYAAEGALAEDIAEGAIDAINGSVEGEAKVAAQLGATASMSGQQMEALLSASVYAYLNEAVTALENAKATTALVLTDPSDAEVLGGLGDAAMLVRQDDAARTAYRRALEAFAEANEPTEQVPSMADTLARWASLRMMLGACAPNAAADLDWNATWARLGMAPPDICAFKQAAPAPSATALPSVVLLMRGEIRRCPPPEPVKPGQSYAASDAAARSRLVACHDNEDSRTHFAQAGISAEQIDAELTAALETKQ